MFLFSLAKKNKNSGISLIEAIIGISLLLVVFIGIFVSAQLGIKLTGHSKARVAALALANQKLEIVRNLPYNQIGTISGIPSGSITETEIITRNNVPYTVKITVVYVDDSFDNLFPSDALAWDYKRIKVNVSWPDSFGGQVFLQTDVTPKGIETTGSGGIISILVFDANGQPVPQADIHIENNVIFPNIDVHYQTDNLGRLFVPGAPACNDCYKITASKADYSSERTYAVGELVGGVTLASPLKPFPSVIEGQLSEISFAIDHLATKTIQTIRYIEEKTWNDTFENENGIAEKFQVAVDAVLSGVKLLEENSQYQLNGYLISNTITPSGLVEWSRLNWNDEIPLFTEIKYQLLYLKDGNWILIPDEDLTVDGVLNSEGFTDSPIDLSQLDTYEYKSVRIKANFSTIDPTQTPILHDWQITWFSSETTIPVSSLVFIMRGAKSLGMDSTGQPAYKYQANLSTESDGQLVVSDLEWDSYRITVNGSAIGYDIADSFLSQPVDINPGVNQTTILKMASHQVNTLLVAVKDSGGVSLIGAAVRLYITGYDKTKITANSGQVFFSPLLQTIYSLEITAAGFQDYLGQVDISGQSEQIIIMTTP